MTMRAHPFSLDAPRPVLLAHRGGGLEAPENSEASIAHLADIGVRNLETDAHASADDVVVLTHDPTLERTTDGTGEVRDHTWEQLSRLRTGDGAGLVRLDALLRDHPELRLNIDLKADSVALPVLAALAAADAWGRVCLASFSARRLRRAARTARRRGHRLATSLGTGDVAVLLVSAWLPSPLGTLVRRVVPGPRRADGFVTDGAVCVQVPERVGPLRVVSPRFVAAAHARGLAVHVWTIDAPEDARRLLDLGVDGLVSDRPSLLAPVVAAALPGIRAGR